MADSSGNWCQEHLEMEGCVISSTFSAGADLCIILLHKSQKTTSVQLLVLLPFISQFNKLLVFALGPKQRCFHSENILNDPVALVFATLQNHFEVLITPCWHCSHTHTEDELLRRQMADQSSKKTSIWRLGWFDDLLWFCSFCLCWLISGQPKPNPLIITAWGTVGRLSHRGSVGARASDKEMLRETQDRRRGKAFRGEKIRKLKLRWKSGARGRREKRNGKIISRMTGGWKNNEKKQNWFCLFLFSLWKLSSRQSTRCCLDQTRKTRLSHTLAALLSP